MPDQPDTIDGLQAAFSERDYVADRALVTSVFLGLQHRRAPVEVLFLAGLVTGGVVLLVHYLFVRSIHVDEEWVDERAWELRDQFVSRAPQSIRDYNDRLGNLLVGGVLREAGLPDSAEAMFARGASSENVDPLADLWMYPAAIRVRWLMTISIRRRSSSSTVRMAK